RHDTGRESARMIDHNDQSSSALMDAWEQEQRQKSQLPALDANHRVVVDVRTLTATLRELVRRSGLSANELARRAGRHPKTMQRYLSAKHYGRRPSLLALSDVLSGLGARLVIELPPEGPKPRNPSEKPGEPGGNRTPNPQIKSSARGVRPCP